MRHSRSAQSGFVLPLTLWILAAITIVAAHFAQQVGQSLREAATRQQHFDAQLAVSSATAQVLYHLSSQRMAPCGLTAAKGCVQLDGRPYRWQGTLVQLQDRRGLLNLQATSDEILQRWLAQQGLSDSQQARLIDTLRDYVDLDDLNRLQGAESKDYRAAKRPPPPNLSLVSLRELPSILGWDVLTAGMKASAVWAELDWSGSVGMNPNTAPLAVLQSLPGLNAGLAAHIIERRQLEPVSADWVDQLSGGRLGGVPSMLITFPADELRVTLWAPGLPWGHQYNVRLTPQGSQAPWQVSSFQRVEQTRDSLERLAAAFGPRDSSATKTSNGVADLAAPAGPASQAQNPLASFLP